MFYLISFPGGRKKAFTLSYDDGQIFDRRLVEIMNKNGLKGTFHLNSNTLDVETDTDWFVKMDEIKTLYAGHEVSCHGFTHPFFTHIPKDQAVAQIWEDRKALEAAAGYPIRGMSYPYGDYDDEFIDIAVKLGMEYSRTVESTGEFYIPKDWMRWHPSCHHNQALDLVDRFLEPVKFNRLSLFYVWGHSFEFNRQNTWDMMEEFCAKMAGHDDIWYATNIEIKDYITAARNLITTTDGTKVYNPSAVTVTVDVNGRQIEIEPGKTVDLTC